jgi:uncharacterized protein (TIGR03067 family)
MLALTMAGALLLGAPALKDGRKPAEPPLGDWAIERIEFDGDLVPVGTHYTLRITADGVAVSWDGVPLRSEPATFFEEVRGKAEVDYGSDSPKAMRKGIWKLEGRTLTICTAAPGADRPSEFNAASGSKHRLWVLRWMPKK